MGRSPGDLMDARGVTPALRAARGRGQRKRPMSELAIDYRALLLRYMRHVGNEEGWTFIPLPDIDGFTPREIEELNAIDDEIIAASAGPKGA